ncbi:unnamed protein product [Rotaria magnacalcarata]|uniref:Uncharacterized protein n=1 Tax=Rotaria magnacalcarata TaxID=392030 RepID=A0A816V062_9BILA|nr:unnamed protein product [Rotaria magnacalcarata]CAF2147776.1 unnamed protein product [Rotaria magnacalcarata]CAF3951705.1 unnamed protein product [Rotaria magnacalcarata]CAF4184313.1 unnamed protein product [Rotaria magnacalcarata]
MAPKKNKEQLIQQENLYIVLRDECSRHYVFARRDLNYNKKDNLKVGSYATFCTPDDPSRRCQATQCENSVSLIEKTININNNDKINDKNDKTSNDKIDNNDDNNNSKKKADKLKSSNKSNTKSTLNSGNSNGNNSVNNNSKSNLNSGKSNDKNNIKNSNINNSQKRKNENRFHTTDKSNKRRNINNDKENYNDVYDKTDTNENYTNDKAYSSTDDVNSDDYEQDETDLDSSSQLVIDDQTEKSDDDNKDDEDSETESVTTVDPTSSQQHIDITSTISQCAAVSKQVNNADAVRDQNELAGTLKPDSKKISSATASNSEKLKLKRENTQLKKEIDMYKKNWMPKPSGAVATYFIEVGKVLSGATADEYDEEEKGNLLEKICGVLDMSEKELKSCEHDTDITKTCRQIIKYIYPDPKLRATMLVSSMDPEQLQAIQKYARLAHPAQARTLNAILNNAMGNVFATDKHRYE